MREFNENDNIGDVLLENMNKKVLSLLYFIEAYFKLRVRNKTSPIDIYYENLSLPQTF